MLHDFWGYEPNRTTMFIGVKMGDADETERMKTFFYALQNSKIKKKNGKSLTNTFLNIY